MPIPALGLVSDAQAVTVTAVSTGTIDLLATPPVVAPDLGFGVSVGVAADLTTGNETYQFDVLSSATSDLATPTVLASFPVPAKQLFAGAALFLPLPAAPPALRWLGVRYTTGGTTPSVTVTTWLTARAVFTLLSQLQAKRYVS
jgi:hypothetical protein